MTENDASSSSERLMSLRDDEAASTDRDLDKELVKASVMGGLFRSMVEPTRVGRFTLIKRIGAGGMGEVYAAFDEQLDRKVAIKLVRPDADHGASQRLMREAQVLARLSHPNVVQVYEVGTMGDRVFLAMEFIRGRSLRQWLGQEDHVPEPQRWRRVLDTFLAAGRGVAAAHAAGLVHRDFKPDNVLMGEDGRVCVADFGLARVASVSPGASAMPDAVSGATSDNAPDATRQASTAPQPTESLTRSGTLMGTPAYMSPEQWHGQPSDSRSDQFSFCVALYEALFGLHPFAAGERALLRERVIAGACKPPPETTLVPAYIWTILQRGLAVVPADRYPDMVSLLYALAVNPRQQWRRRMAAMTLLAAGALLGGVALQAISTPPCEPDAVREAMFTNCALAHTSVMIRVSALAEVGLYRPKYPAAEDYELLRRLATKFDLANLPQYLVDYRVSKAGVSITRRRRQLFDRLRIQLTYFAPLNWGAWAGLGNTLVLFVVPRPLVTAFKMLRDGGLKRLGLQAG